MTIAPSGEVAAARAFLDRLEAHDLEGFLALWADDGVQEMPFAPPGVPQRLSGRDELRTFWTSVFANMKRIAFRDVDVAALVGSRRSISQHQGEVTLVDGRPYNNRYVCVFEFDVDGRLKLYREHFDPLVVVASFGDAATLEQLFDPAA